MDVLNINYARTPGLQPPPPSSNPPASLTTHFQQWLEKNKFMEERI